MANTGRKTTPRELLLQRSHPIPPSPFDVREDGWQTEPHHSLRHTQSFKHSPSVDQAIDFDYLCSSYLYALVTHAPVITNLTCTQDNEQDVREGELAYLYTRDLLQLEPVGHSGSAICH